MSSSPWTNVFLRYIKTLFISLVPHFFLNVSTSSAKNLLYKQNNVIFKTSLSKVKLNSNNTMNKKKTMPYPFNKVCRGNISVVDNKTQGNLIFFLLSMYSQYLSESSTFQKRFESALFFLYFLMFLSFVSEYISL